MSWLNWMIREKVVKSPYPKAQKILWRLPMPLKKFNIDNKSISLRMLYNQRSAIKSSILYYRWVAQYLPSLSMFYYFISTSAEVELSTSICSPLLVPSSSGTVFLVMFSSSWRWSYSTKSGASMLTGSETVSFSKMGVGHFWRKVIWELIMS